MIGTIPTDYLDAIWRAVRADEMTWDDAAALQEAAYPRCSAHDKPAPASIHGTPVCPQCMEERRTEARDGQR